MPPEFSTSEFVVPDARPVIPNKIDVFSLGCIFYFALSNVDHAFEEEFAEDTSSMLPTVAQSSIYHIVEKNWQRILAKSLIENMIKTDPYERPNVEEILQHPIFWNVYKAYTFFHKCFETMNSYEKELNQTKIENNASNVIQKNWIDHLKSDFSAQQQKASGSKVKDLLFFISEKVCEIKYLFVVPS
jgi:serine/threonine-protein kinase/endoribonuclease IRE1